MSPTFSFATLSLRVLTPLHSDVYPVHRRATVVPPRVVDVLQPEPALERLLRPSLWCVAFSCFTRRLPLTTRCFASPPGLFLFVRAAYPPFSHAARADGPCISSRTALQPVLALLPCLCSRDPRTDHLLLALYTYVPPFLPGSLFAHVYVQRRSRARSTFRRRHMFRGAATRHPRHLSSDRACVSNIRTGQ